MPPLTITADSITTADCITTTTGRIIANPDLERIERQLDQMENDMNFLGEKNRKLEEAIRLLDSTLSIKNDIINTLRTDANNLKARVDWLEGELIRVRSKVEVNE